MPAIRMRMNVKQGNDFAHQYADRKLTGAALDDDDWSAYRALYRHVAFSVSQHQSMNGENLQDVAREAAEVADNVLAPFVHPGG